MSQTLVREVTVDELTKFGLKENNEYVNYSKSLSEADRGKFVPGGSYTCEVYVADSGKNYINKIVGGQPAVSVCKTVVKTVSADVVPDVARAKRYTPKAEAISAGLSKNEWHDKDVRISRQGLLQSAFIALAPVVALDQLFGEAEKLADKGLEYVNRLSPKVS